jgi:hypothetical protein
MSFIAQRYHSVFFFFSLWEGQETFTESMSVLGRGWVGFGRNKIESNEVVCHDSCRYNQ